MAELGTMVQKIRSKNAGPFWLTVDIFCGSCGAFERVCASLTTARVAAVFGADEARLKRFEIADLKVLKFSLPRPEVQGSLRDRDMHGASWAALIGELDMPE